MKKLCIFDLDGTITDTITAIAHFGNIGLKAVNLEPIEKDKYKYFAGDGRVKLIHRMLDFYNADTEENYNKASAAYDSAYEADPMYKTDAFDGMKETLTTLKESGVHIAVCSNKPHNVVCDVVKSVFGDIPDIVKGIGEGDIIKPDPSNTLKIIDKIGVDKKDCLFIGDTNIDIHTGKNAGIDTVGVLWGFRDRAELEEAGADYIISKPRELINIVKGR